MAECQDWRYSYFYVTLYANIGENNSSQGYSKVDWSLVLHHSKLSVSNGVFDVYIDGQHTSLSTGALNFPSGGADYTIGSGSNYVYHTEAKDIGFSFSSGINWNISGRNLGGMGANGTLSLPQLAVSPSLPTSVSVSGGNGGWMPMSNPVFNVSWSGAKSGTYYIDGYSIDASRDGWTNSTNVGGVVSVSNAGSGSKNNVSLAGISGLKGGDVVRIRVGMRTSDGTWWGHSYWGGTFTMYTNPTAPTTFTTPTSVEIDTSYSISWSGAKAGSNGLAGYDLQVRGYNGSTWSEWYNVLVCKNQTSYTVGTPKNVKINGVNYYSTYGSGVRFQYRVRSSDNKIAASDWITGNATSITIYSPTSPRK